MRALMSDNAERWITQQTGGRVHCLDIDSLDGQVVVRGRVSSHGMRQLVLESLNELLDDPNTVLHLDLSVTGRKQHALKTT